MRIGAMPSGQPKTYTVKAIWDEEASIWVVDDSDVPGLVTGAPTIPELLDKLNVLIPELLELNGEADGGDVPIELLTSQRQVIRRCA